MYVSVGTTPTKNIAEACHFTCYFKSTAHLTELVSNEVLIKAKVGVLKESVEMVSEMCLIFVDSVLQPPPPRQLPPSSLLIS